MSKISNIFIKTVGVYLFSNLGFFSLLFSAYGPCSMPGLEASVPSGGYVSSL